MIKLWRKLDTRVQETLGGAFNSLIIRVLGTLIGFFLTYMLSGLLNADGVGIYFLALSIVTISSTISRIGFDNTIVKFISIAASKERWDVVASISQRVTFIVAVTSFSTALALFFASEWLALDIFNKPYMEQPFQIIAFAIVPLSLSIIYAESLRALKKIMLSEFIKVVSISTLILILLYPLVYTEGVHGATISYVVASYITLLLSVLLWSKSTPWPREEGEGGAPHTKELLASSLPLFSVAMAVLLMQNSAIVFLGIYASATDVGVYAISNRISALLLFPLMSLITIYAPKIAVMYEEEDISEVSRFSKRCSLITSIFVIPIAVIVGVFAKSILSIFGDSFDAGVLVIRVLLIGVVVNALTGPVSNILMMSGHEAVVRNMSIIGALVTILLCAVCIPVWGSVGAAIATTGGISLQNILMLLQVKRYLGFVPMMIPQFPWKPT